MEVAGQVAHLLSTIGDELKKKPEFAVAVLSKRVSSAKAMGVLKTILEGVQQEFRSKRPAEKEENDAKKVVICFCFDTHF